MKRTLVALLALLSAPVPSFAETVSGTATYLQRMMLPPDAVVEVVLEDVSRADAPAETLAMLRIESPGAPPYPFAFEVSSDRIDARHRYGLRARVRQGDRLLMTTDTAYQVLTGGAPNEVEMVMKMVAGGAEPPKPDVDFVNTYWRILTLGGAPVAVADNQREPHVILRPDGSYNATVGCNMIRGAQSVEGTTVSFKPGAMTMMACPSPLDVLERGLTQALDAATSFEIEGESMRLLDASGAELATFAAVYF